MNCKLSLIAAIFAEISSSYAATAIDLRHQSPQLLQAYLPNKTLATHATNLKTIKTDIDSKQTMHTRIQQTFAGIPVWGGDAIIHTPNASKKNIALLITNKQSTMNGIVYQDLEKDLIDRSVLNETQKQKAIETAKKNYLFENKNTIRITEESATPLIFIENMKAHYAYKISFYVLDKKTGSHRPITIMDAATFNTYKTWDSIETFATQKVESIGGNPIIGKLFYDDSSAHLTKLNMYVEGNQCKFENDYIVLKRGLAADIEKNNYPSISAPCHNVNGVLKIDEHTKESYEGADGFNGAYSPASDALYNVNLTQQLYQQWYGIPAFADPYGKTKKMTVLMHYNSEETGLTSMENARFDATTETFIIGDGSKDAYPFTELDIIAHELSHGFTEQNSHLVYNEQSGGMNESFSDMGSKAVEFMVTHQNKWALGAATYKSGNPLRYMDEPTKDGMSIDNVKNYNRQNVHFTSGIFNKTFYLLARTSGWDTKKAFDVMVAANRFYWTPTSTFNQGACGVVAAASHFNYSVKDVENAFAKVGITDLQGCANLDPYHKETSWPFCDYKKDGEPLSKDQLPCHTSEVDVILAIESQGNTITLSNFINEYREVSVNYYENCASNEVRPKEIIVKLAAHKNKTISIKSDCTAENVIKHNPDIPKKFLYRMSTIRIMHRARGGIRDIGVASN